LQPILQAIEVDVSHRAIALARVEERVGIVVFSAPANLASISRGVLNMDVMGLFWAILGAP
jgi:hypothetical protein